MDLSLNLPSSIGGNETPGTAGKKKFELKTAPETKKKKKCC